MKAVLRNCILLFFTAILQGLQGQSLMLQGEIEKIIRHEANIDFTLVPGILVSVLDQDSTYFCSFGEKMDKEAIYEIGSLTKPFVAWLVDQALDSLGWTRGVGVCRFLPDSLCSSGWEQLTIEQVLTHRSGLPRMPSGINASLESGRDPYVSFDSIALAQALDGMIPVPGKYRYSNMAYALLAWLFDRVGGMESFASKRLMKPFALGGTGWMIPDGDIAQGHGFDGRIIPPWHVGAMAPAMGLKTSMEDLVKLLDIISPQLIADSPVLSSALRKELNALDKAGEYKVIDGWFLIQTGKELFYYHTGRTGGHQVSIAFIPGKRKGVVVISNGAAGSNDLSMLILNMIARDR